MCPVLVNHVSKRRVAPTLPQQCLGLSNIQLAQSTPLLKVICQTTAHIKLSRPWRDV